MPVAFEREPDDNGERLIWLAPEVVNRLRALRGPGESYSDVILRFVEFEAKGAGGLYRLYMGGWGELPARRK